MIETILMWVGGAALALLEIYLLLRFFSFLYRLRRLFLEVEDFRARIRALEHSFRSQDKP